MSNDRLQRTFIQWWPLLNESLEKARALLKSSPIEKQEDIRSERDILNEILDTLRALPWDQTHSKWVPVPELPAQNELIFICAPLINIPSVKEVIGQAKEAEIVKNSLITPLANDTYSIRIIFSSIDKYGDFLPYYNSLSELGLTVRTRLSANS